MPVECNLIVEIRCIENLLPPFFTTSKELAPDHTGIKVPQEKAIAAGARR